MPGRAARAARPVRLRGPRPGCARARHPGLNARSARSTARTAASTLRACRSISGSSNRSVPCGRSAARSPLPRRDCDVSPRSAAARASVTTTCSAPPTPAPGSCAGSASAQGVGVQRDHPPPQRLGLELVRDALRGLASDPLTPLGISGERVDRRRRARPASSTATSTPDSPSTTSSGTPPTRVATGGTAAAIASSSAIGRFSSRDGRTKTSSASSRVRTSSTRPWKCASTRSARACCFERAAQRAVAEDLDAHRGVQPRDGVEQHVDALAVLQDRRSADDQRVVCRRRLGPAQVDPVRHDVQPAGRKACATGSGQPRATGRSPARARASADSIAT